MCLMELPRNVRTMLSVLRENGHSGYLVGGCVRDACMGLTPHDYDMATDATPAQIRQCFAAFRTLDTGVAHGTVTVLIDHAPVELTTFRVDGSYADHRHPTQVAFTARLEQDLARRDFTINAMAYDGAQLIDPFGGMRDLAARFIRCVGDADKRFDEDGLRILRAMRFAAVLGFAVEPSTAAAIHRHREVLRVISAERIWAECARLLQGKNAPAVLQAYEDVLRVFLPQADADGVRQLALSPCDVTVRLALLLQSTDAEHALRDLRADKKTIRAVTQLLSMRRAPIRRMLAANAPALVHAYWHLAFARGEIDEAEQTRLHRETDEILRQSPCLDLRDLAVNGTDLQALGLRDRAIGQTLRRLFDAVLDGDVPNEKEALLHMAADSAS